MLQQLRSIGYEEIRSSIAHLYHHHQWTESPGFDRSLSYLQQGFWSCLKSKAAMNSTARSAPLPWVRLLNY
jgi:hypothetical protein